MDINIHESMKEVLARHAGKRISLRLHSGEDFSGTLATVGDHLVHLSELSGQEFYDAVLSISNIAGLILRVRGD